jgi:adenosylhomocysteine nucleosidase
MRVRRADAPTPISFGLKPDLLNNSWSNATKNAQTGKAGQMIETGNPLDRQVLVLAPMPLEMDAITTAFGLEPERDETESHWTGVLGSSHVTAVHIGMGPPLTRIALERLLDDSSAEHLPVDHVIVAGICGGLDPDREVGTLINPAEVVDYTSGTAYLHDPPGDVALSGKLVTTENATLDIALSKRFFEDGFIGVDMETAAVAELCQKYGVPWSAYRCIGDRWFDGLLDERVLAMTNPDGSGSIAELERLLAEDPEFVRRLEQLGRDTSRAARLAAEAAVRGCLALDNPLPKRDASQPQREAT